MGAATSIVEQQAALHGEPEWPPHTASVRGSVTRSSVRAMALMNHARQENSYISVDKVSAQFLSRPRDPAVAVKLQRKFRDKPSQSSEDSYGTERKAVEGKHIDESVHIVEETEPEPGPEPGQEGLQSLSMFRSNFVLKLQVSDDQNDWAQV
jgi:hypothetical protein